MRSPPPALWNHHSGLWGPPNAHAAQGHQGALPRFLGSRKSRSCGGNWVALHPKAWDFLQGEAASSLGTQAPQSLPSHTEREETTSPKVQMCLSSRKLAVKLKSVSGEERNAYVCTDVTV